MASEEKLPTAVIKFGKKLEAALGTHKGEAVLVTKHDGNQVIVFHLDDLETLLEIYMEHCSPEEGEYLQ